MRLRRWLKDVRRLQNNSASTDCLGRASAPSTVVSYVRECRSNNTPHRRNRWLPGRPRLPAQAQLSLPRISQGGGGKIELRSTICCLRILRNRLDGIYLY